MPTDRTRRERALERVKQDAEMYAPGLLTPGQEALQSLAIRAYERELLVDLDDDEVIDRALKAFGTLPDWSILTERKQMRRALEAALGSLANE